MRTSIRLLCFLALCLPAPAATIWVTPDGRDDGAGDEARPFATLSRAREALRELGRTAPTEDVTVRLRAGVYALSEPIEFTPDHLGSGERTITFAGEPNGQTLITGSRELRGQWRRVAPTLWCLALPDAAQNRWTFRSLFRSGRWLQRAHEPDEGHYTATSVDAERRRLALQPKLPDAWMGLAGVEINSVAHWHYNRQPLAEIAGSSVTARRPIGTDASSARLSAKSHHRIWLENAREFVDTPGEWFLDRQTGELLLCTQPEEDPNQTRFTAAAATELLVIRGTPQRPVRKVAFRDLTFAETDWEMPEEGRLGLQAGAWGSERSRTYSPTAAIRIQYAAGIAIEHCTFRDLGEGAVACEAGVGDASITRCTFRRVGANVIQVGRMPTYTGVGHPLHRDFASFRERLDEQPAIPGAAELYQQFVTIMPEAPTRILISDNTLEDCLHLDFGSVGIWVGYANHVRIEHNLLRHLPYTGISVGWRWAPGLTHCHSNLIAHNRVEAVMRQAGDGAGIYLVGEQPGTRVLDNYIHDSRGSYSERGLYLDEFADHMEVAGNYLTGISDRSIYLHKNGPNQNLHDNNGEPGPTALPEADNRGRRWMKYDPERPPPQPELYGPRR